MLSIFGLADDSLFVGSCLDLIAIVRELYCDGGATKRREGVQVASDL